MALVKWLMGVWGTANSMGLKRVANMIKEFKYIKYDPGKAQ
jgi:hypothetical protein